MPTMITSADAHWLQVRVPFLGWVLSPQGTDANLGGESRPDDQSQLKPHHAASDPTLRQPSERSRSIEVPLRAELRGLDLAPVHTLIYHTLFLFILISLMTTYLL
jgi:hypothetical protein